MHPDTVKFLSQKISGRNLEKENLPLVERKNSKVLVLHWKRAIIPIEVVSAGENRYKVNNHDLTLGFENKDEFETSWEKVTKSLPSNVSKYWILAEPCARADARATGEACFGTLPTDEKGSAPGETISR